LALRKLRAALARRESGRGRRFAPELRHQLSSIGRQLQSQGELAGLVPSWPADGNGARL